MSNSQKFKIMKKTYGFYNVNDKTAEIISLGSFENEQQAIEFFASRKQMDVESFLKVFHIIKLND
jgi:hypothetical protein